MEKNVEDGRSHGVGLAAEAKLEEPATKQLDLLVNAGNDLVREKRYQEAVTTFERAAALDRNRPDIYVYWGRALVGLERYEQARLKFERAIQRFQRATELDHQRVEAWYGWGRALVGLAESEQALLVQEPKEELLQQAVSKFERAIALDKGFSRASLAAGEALLQLERYRDALRQYNMVIETESRSPAQHVWILISAYYSSSRALVELERYPEAITSLESALQLIKNFEATPDLTNLIAAIRYLLGVIHADLKHDDEAMKQLLMVSDASPALAVHSRTAMAGIFWRRGQYPDAWGQLGRVAAEHEQLRAEHEQLRAESGALNADYLTSVGAAVSELGDLDAAEEIYREVLKHEDHVRARVGLVDVYLRRRADDPENAAYWYREAREESKRAEALIRNELQVLQDELKDLEEQRRSADGATSELLLERHELITRRRASRLLDLGTRLLAVDDYEEAKPFLKEAIRLRPELAPAYANVGVIDERQDDPKQAASYFLKAWKRDPDNLQLRVNLGEAYSRLGLLEKAAQEYQAVLRIAACNIEAHLGLGEVLTALGDSGDPDYYVQAIHHFTKAMELHGEMDAPEPMDRRGSTKLTKKQLAAAHYARGYVRIQLYEARLGETIFTPWEWQRSLRQARDDFMRAREFDPEHFKAQRAVEKITQRYKRLSSQRIAERWAPIFVAALALAILLLIQSSFFAQRPAVRLKEEYYVLLTFGSLMFVAAAFYLPQVLKLKVAGVELEKSSVEKVTVPTTIGIPRDPFSVKESTQMPSDLLATRHRPRTPRRSHPAAKGAHDVGTRRNEKGDSAQEAAEFGPQEVKDKPR